VTRRKISAESPFFKHATAGQGGSIVKMKISTGHGDDIVLEGEVNEWPEKNPSAAMKDIRRNLFPVGTIIYPGVCMVQQLTA
jgi:hypothetical protein